MTSRDTPSPAATDAASPAGYRLGDREFETFRAMVLRDMGISLSAEKRALVAGRLMKRLRHFGLTSYQDYLALALDEKNEDERRVLLNLLTTNETHFFREDEHFGFLAKTVIPARSPSAVFRAWSAACSTGEEAYTIAMVLAEHIPASSWEVMGSDANDDVLSQARSGVYPISAREEIPEPYLKKYCLKGVRSQEGTLLIDPAFAAGIRFLQINLVKPLPVIGLFDVVFLRNVMIYFNRKTKREVLERIIPSLKPGGYLFVGHMESLMGIGVELRKAAPSVYRVP
ncbi:MAG: protein-glutamate O-methyltransferase CheR [Spirochaetes bacterium]|nr:MAG: protein-glutamate O-methyltransferase CheR [Spirochaetota bacterium]